MAGREQTAETVVGALVLAAAAAFLVYALGAAGRGGGTGGYEVTARFGQVGGLAPGADVRVAGVKVGTVADLSLDPQTYLAVTRLALDGDVKLPADSTAKITSDGLLGGSHVAIAPGGSPENLPPGGQIENVQGAVDLFGLIGQVIRPQGGASGAAPPSTAPADDPYPEP
jgi:phospholipid/cholesterol/gamma-HCH transport system substrate-binding protein